MVTRIILVRHCEAQGNAEEVFQGHMNGAVTENGLLQLSYLAEKMKAYPFDYLYSSPLIRAVMTAKACNTYYGKPIGLIEDLMEIHGGEWEGQKWDTFPKEYARHNEAWLHRPWSFVAPEGEAMANVYRRMSETVDMLARRHAGKTVCIASHGCAIRNYLCYAKGLQLEKLNEVAWCDNTGISVVEYDDDFTVRLITENDNSHIPDSVSTLSKQTWWRNKE